MVKLLIKELLYMKRVVFILILLSPLIVTLNACQSLSRSRAPLALPVDPSQTHLSVFQQIEIKKGEKYYRFDAAISFNNEAMHLRLLSELGQELAIATLKNGKVSTQRSGFLFGKPPVDLVLHALQQSFWPNDILAKAIDAYGGHIDEQKGKRQTYIKSALESYTDYDTRCAWSGEAHYFNVRDNYNVRFRSIILSKDHPFQLHESHCPPN